MPIIFKWVGSNEMSHIFHLKLSQWTSEERIMFLKKLIVLLSKEERLEFHKFVKTIVPETAVDFTRLLPRVISLRIFSFLDPRSLCRACQVCRFIDICCH